jgi:uncharacterized membrane protein YsdA (DUF1294 family)/cold shock CspA family protein
MRYQGRITHWNDAKGFGFVTPQKGGEKVFVHIKSFTDRRIRPVEGDLISYTSVRDSQQRLRAENITFSGQSSQRTRPESGAHRSTAGYVLAAVFAVLVVALTSAEKIPVGLLFIYLVCSGITFIAYAFDKAAAMNKRWRTQEATLHLLSLAGGWPGALVAQKMFRHKSSKREFLLVFWSTVVANCGALVWFMTDKGVVFLRASLSL